MKSDDMPELIKALDDNIEIIRAIEKSNALVAETKMMFNMDENIVTAIDEYRELDYLKSLAEDTPENDTRRATLALIRMYDMKEEREELGVELKDLFEAAIIYGYQKGQE